MHAAVAAPAAKRPVRWGLLALALSPLVVLAMVLLVIRKVPPDFRRDEPVLAAGRLVRVRQATGDRSRDLEGVRRFAQDRGVAPVARGAQESGWAPAVVSDERPDAATPPLPPPPHSVTRLASAYGSEYRMRCGRTALRVSGSSAAADQPLDPVLFSVNFRRGRSTHHLQRLILKAAAVDAVGGVAYGRGAGVLIVLQLHETRLAGQGASRSLVYRATAPSWEPVLALRAQGDNGRLTRCAQGPDGRHVYLAQGPSASPAEILWNIDNSMRTARRIVIRGGSIGGDYIPSPRGDLLASRSSLGGLGGPIRHPMEVVRLADGRVFAVTSRRRGHYLDGAVAWSATVEGRVYFADVFLNLYALDLDLSRVPAQ